MGKLVMINKYKKGQIAIIVLLASAVILTLGLSASKKTITETKIETDQESLEQVFNAAESAINNFLGTGNTSYTIEGSNANVVSRKLGNSNRLESEGKVLANSNQLFWLVNHNDNGGIGVTYYSGTSVSLSVDADFKGALKVDYFYKNGSVFGVKRFGCRYDDGNSNSLFNTGFTGDCSNISLALGSPLLISVTPVGGSTNLAISGSANFPIQGEELTASSSTGSDVKTQIKTRYIYQFPSFMLDAMTAKNIIQ